MLNLLHTWINKRLFLCVIVAIAAGYFFPLTATPFLKGAVMVLFSYMTFATALGTSMRDFLKVASRPIIPLYILGIVHIVTPVVAWLYGKMLFPANPYIQIGYLISAAIPVGVTSVIWTSMTKGNIPVALVTVTLGTILAPLLLPVFILFVISAKVSINYANMTVDLMIMITLPSIAGMLLYDVTNGKTKNFAQGIGGVLSKLAFFTVIFLSSAFVTPAIEWNYFVFKVLVVTGLMVASGYCLGYLAGRLINADHGTALAIMYNAGMRNIATGLVVASNYFPPEVAIPITLSMLFQQPLAALAARLFNRVYPACRPKAGPEPESVRN